tara:strand:- start:603 stop:1661 length:1059 start_codon:yes stop_codon:yes gene_type:complete
MDNNKNMDFKAAIFILNIGEKEFITMSEPELKKKYHIQALKYHPDKYKEHDANIKFHSINEAYTVLLKCKKYANYRMDKNSNLDDNSGTPNFSFNDFKFDSDSDFDFDFDRDFDFKMPSCFNATRSGYSELLREFLSSTDLDDKLIRNIMFIILNNSIRGIFKWCIDNINKEVLLKIYTTLREYNDIFKLPEDFYDDMYNSIKEKYDNENIIIINPSIKDLFNQNIYILNYNEHKLYIPLWHHELYYELGGKKLTVKCVPDFMMIDNNYYDLDSNNNIHINHNIDIDKELLNKEFINIQIDYREFRIQINELKIREKQVYVIKEKGIPKINDNDIYSTDKLSDIIVHLTMNK